MIYHFFARVALVALMLMQGIACASSPRSEFGTVLQALPVDSLCGGRCTYILVDSLVREGKAMAAGPGDFLPVVSRIGQQDLPGSSRNSATTPWALGVLTADYHGKDTLELRLYRVSPASEPGTQVYGVVIMPPERAMRALRLTVREGVVQYSAFGDP